MIILKDEKRKAKANYVFSVFLALNVKSSARVNKNQSEDRDACWKEGLGPTFVFALHLENNLAAESFACLFTNTVFADEHFSPSQFFTKTSTLRKSFLKRTGFPFLSLVFV